MNCHIVYKLCSVLLDDVLPKMLSFCTATVNVITMSSTTYHWDIHQWQLIMTTLTTAAHYDDSKYYRQIKYTEQSSYVPSAKTNAVITTPKMGSSSQSNTHTEKTGMKDV